MTARTITLQYIQNPLSRGSQTPPAALPIPACGDGHFRVRRFG